MATHSPDHSWWYYPNMQPDEVMLILTYDSAAAPFVPTLHCAFDDPASPAATEEGAQRESIEARLLLVMPELEPLQPRHAPAGLPSLTLQSSAASRKHYARENFLSHYKLFVKCDV